jgi:uncharacterized membrane protein YfcA
MPIRRGVAIRPRNPEPRTRNPVPVLLFLVIGLGAGVLSGLFGIGGGIVIVPALLWFAKFQPQVATGTSLGALLLPVGALGAWQYWKSGSLEPRASLLIAAGLFVGAFFGARIALALPAPTLRKVFAAFLVLVAMQLWFKK